MSDIDSSIASNLKTKFGARHVLSIALAYAFMGWAGLALAIPPSYASPVFPAAGLALGCTLWFGPTALLGVLLGAVLLNLSQFWWTGILSPSTAIAAMVISAASSLQAWAGSRLVRRWQGSAWQILEREQDVLVFMLLGGVLAVLIPAAVGVTTLLAFGVIERADVPFSIWNWYTGDVLGVMLFAPFTLGLLDRRSELWRERRRRIVLPMLLTLGLVALAFYGAARWERQYQAIQLDVDSQIVVARITDRAIAHREVLSSVKRFIEVTPDFTFDQFEEFTRITLAENPDVFALSFNDLIADGKRAEFESRMSRLSPLGPFQITEREETGELIRAQTRPEYVTVRYIVPLYDNRSAVGYDIYFEPTRRAAIDRARTSGAMAVTAPIRLVQEQRQRVGLLELLPVSGAPAGAVGRQGEHLAGFVVAVVKIDEMIDIATRGYVPAGLGFQLIDSHAHGHESLLCAFGSPSGGNLVPHLPSPWKTTLFMGDRHWELRVYPTEDYRRRHRPWMAWAACVGGLLFAAQLQILMLGMTGRASMQKQAREKLAHSHDLMRYIIEHANSAVAVHDRALRYIFVSQSYLGQYKINERNVYGKHHYDVFPDLPRKWRDVHQRALAGEVCSADRDPYHRADGTVEWTRWECRPWYEADGTVGGIIVYTEIITDRVRAEETLIHSEALLRKSQEIGRIGSWELDLADYRLAWSDEVYRIFGLRPDEFAASHEAFIEAVHPDDRELVNAAYSASIREGHDSYEIEHRIVRRSDGAVRTVLEKCEHLKDATGAVVRSVGMVQDVTERKQNEAVLRASLEEKTALLQEIHHRVKNNLQIVSSLLSLQAGDEKLKPVTAALRDTQNRIRSMATLHEMLYRSDSLARVNYAGYIAELCTRLFIAFGADSQRVKLDCCAAPVELNMVQAIPCGLILNELVSNALEHAFPDGRSGRITVELRPHGEEYLLLAVTDDGAGLPPGLDIGQASSMGMQLVRILTRQLKGSLDVERGQGTAFRVTFPGI